MIIISKIRIEYYRSLKNVTIRSLNHLNIFSGQNDIGKSNVLKAMDLFFNVTRIDFLDDYNKERLDEVRKESIKGRQFIRITVEFNNPGSYTSLPDVFEVSKSWDRNGNIVEGHRDNFEMLVKRGKMNGSRMKSARTSLTKLMNRVRYTYVPAIRDENFFAYLLNKLQETIFEVEERKKNQTFQKKIISFNKTIADLTKSLNNDFEDVSGIASSLSFPNNVAEIFQRLIIDTKSGEHNIPLRMRGDGIRLRYIPTILNYISSNSKYFEIWGFDEPENSCEYSLSKKIAKQFSDEYLDNAQIFVASHSFHFISIMNEYTSKYRVYREAEHLSTEVAQIDESNKNLLSNELGILDINHELSRLYESLSKELLVINETKKQLRNIKKPYLIFEGKTDNTLFSKAYEALYSKPILERFILCEHIEQSSGGTVGSGAPFINQYMFNHIAKTPTDNYVIAIFDFDEAGYNEITALEKLYVKLDDSNDNFILYRHKDKNNFYAMTLVIPEHRENFFDKNERRYCYVSSELLFVDDVIPKSNRKYPTRFDQTVFMFTGKKETFSNSKQIGNDDFSGFKPTFELIEKILKGKYKNAKQKVD